MILTDNDDDDVVSEVFIKEDPIESFSVSGEDNFLGKKWSIRTFTVSQLAGKIIVLGKKWLIWTRLINYPPRGRH